MDLIPQHLQQLQQQLQQQQQQLQQQQQQQQQPQQQPPQLQQQPPFEPTMDYMMNGFFNHEASPSILGLQMPNFLLANNPLLNSEQATGLEARYKILINVIDELKKDVKPTYAGSRPNAERLKRNINLARIEIRNCIQELDTTQRSS